MIAPELLDQAVAGHDLVGAEQQEGDERPLARSPEGYRPVVEPRFERAEQPELERVVACHRPVTRSSSPGSILPPRRKPSNQREDRWTFIRGRSTRSPRCGTRNAACERCRPTRHFAGPTAERSR